LLTDCASLSRSSARVEISAAITAGEPFHSYDHQLALEVMQRLRHLIDSLVLPAGSGKVVVKFRIDSTGKVSSPSIVLNETSEILGLVCKRAILDPSP